MNTKKYYSSKGDYLDEHKNYFSDKQLQIDVDFLISALRLSKKDKILDVACGNGRHTIELNKCGFNVDGLDFSSHLLGLAKKASQQAGLRINFYKQNINNINHNIKYDKILLFFSDFSLFDVKKTLKNIKKILKPKGIFLLDCDNVFRLIKYLSMHSEAPFVFDFITMRLKEKKKDDQGIRYYIIPELEKIFNDNNLKIKHIYGNYSKERLDGNSQRMIILAQKMTR